METADKPDTRRADEPRERGEGGHASEDDVAPPSPIQIASEAGMAGDFELPDPKELRKIESDTQSRLKAILEVAGVTGLSQIDAQTFQDPEILRKLTNSVSSALDEAATALTRMKTERGSYEAFLRGAHQPSPPSPPLTITPSPNPAPRAAGDGQGAVAAQGTGGEGGRGGKGAGGWVQSHDVVQGGNGGPQQQQQSADTEVAVGGAGGGASQGESIQTMHRLLTQGQNIQDASEDGESLLSLACSAGYYELAEVLLRMRASVEDRGVKGDSTPLMEAASGGYADIVKLLISHGANVNAKSSAGNTALTYACCGGYEDVVRLLLEAGAEVEHQNENGHTPLMEAASCGHVGVAKLLLDYGANINTHSNEFKESALTLACYKGHLEMVKFLLNAGADQEHKTDEMHTALMEASMDGHVDVARLLLDHGAQVNMPVDSFESPLTLAACGGHYDLVALLISRGADLEEVNDEGYTPLMEASREGHEEVVTLLVEHGAHVNGQTEETQETALTLACCGGFLEVVQYLIEHGADIELGASTPLMEASQEGHVDIVKYLIERGSNVHAETSTQDTPLTYASANGHTIIVDILLQCGAHLEHECEGGRTPLMKAARAGHLQTVQFLVTKGAGVNRYTANNDHTVLSLACSGGHVTAVQYLLSQGADPTHILRDNATMLTEASRGGHMTVANLLLRQPRVQPPSTSHHSSTRASKDFHHYERIKLASGRKPHSHARNPHHQHHHHHHHQHHQQYASQAAGSTGKQLKPAATGAVAVEAGLAVTQTDATGHQNHDQVSSTTSQDSENAKTQRNTQAALADDRGVGAGGMGGTEDTGGSAKRQKISEKESNGQPVRHQATVQSMETAAGGTAEPSLPPRNIIRTAPTGSNPSYVTPHSSGSQVCASSTTTVTTSNSSNHQQQQQHSSSSGDASSIDASLPASSTNQQLSAEDVLMHCMLQMAQAQAVNPAPNSGPSTAPASWPSSDMTGVVTTTAVPTAATTSAPSSSSSSSGGTPHNLKPGKAGALESPNSMFSRGNFASLDHLSALSQPVGVATSPVSTQPHSAAPKFHARGKTATIPSTPGTATTMTSSSSSNTSSSAPSTLPTPSTAFSNADITRLIPHLEAIAGSLQNTPSLESHCLAALAQSQLLPALAQYDPDTPQTAQLPDSLQNVPLMAPGLSSDGKQLLLPNSATIDPATLLANLDMNTLMQNLASPELQASDLSSDMHTQPVYPADFSSLKRLSQKMQAAAVAQSSSSSSDRASGGGGGGGHQLEADLLQSRARPLTASFLLDHNFPMDIPPPTDLLPEHLPLPSGYVPTVENESYLSSEEEDLDEDGSDTSYLAQEIALPPGSYDPAIEIDQQTDSNHDTALTLAAAGGHDELVELLISHGANIEHRDKKGCTPLILAASAGHAVTVAILLDHSGDIEAQSDRTKDTALSLACSGGRQEVVEILLAKGANFEHRNVSDYTPLSLAASGGYVNIIKMLLRAGADINSRTGSKLGITPLMLAAMNGHTSTVKLLLDMGSDINAQIETNRNTALTLACFQGRHEVVSLLVERQANVEHRAKTGLTPLMEAASGGYHEVGRVLINRGADVNAAPVPSSRDTALTIAADKGHYRFVDLILREGAHVDVKNKKGNSPLWLAANGGHLDVVRLLVDHGSDVDSQDNRKVSCLMAAFRKGHFKVVKFLVDHVSQFPSDAELTRYISTLSDKEILKKCQRCMEVIIDAKERQAAEANKNATILLQEIDQEKKHEEDRKAAAARKRAKKKRQKEKKQALKFSVELCTNHLRRAHKGDKVGDKAGGCTGGDSPPEGDHADDLGTADDIITENGEVPDDLSPVDRIPPPKDPLPVPLPLPLPLTKKQSPSEREKLGRTGDLVGGRLSSRPSRLPSTSTSIGGVALSPGGVVSPNLGTAISSPRKGKKEDGWKEVGKRIKKVSVPGTVFAAVVGKNSSHLAFIKQATNTHIEIERTSKTASTRTLSIRGSTEAIKHAQHLLSLLIKDPAHNIASILPKSTLPHPHTITSTHSHTHSHKPHPVPHDTSALPPSMLFDDTRIHPTSSTAIGIATCAPTTAASIQSVQAAMGVKSMLRRANLPASTSTASVSRAATVTSFPVFTGTKPTRVLTSASEKRHSAPQSVLATIDLKHVAANSVASAQSRVGTSMVAGATTVKFSTPLTPTSGPVRRLFTTAAVHSGPMQTVAVVSAAQTTAPILTQAPSMIALPATKTVSSVAPPAPRVPPITTAAIQLHMAPLGTKPLPHPAATVVQTTVAKQPHSQPDLPKHYEIKTTKVVIPPSAAPATNLSYSRVIGSHLGTLPQPPPPPSSMIEQPLQQIMRTPTIFQEPAMQITKPKKYSDAVGKKISEAAGYSLPKVPVTASSVMTAPTSLAPSSSASLPHPASSLPPSFPPPSLPLSLTSSLPSLPLIPLLPSSMAPKLNLAPGTRPVMAEDILQVTSQHMPDKFKSSPWVDRDLAATDHRQCFDDEEKIPLAPNLGPIGPPSKIPKPLPPGGSLNMKSTPGAPPGPRGGEAIGGGGRGEGGGRFSPIGPRSRASPSSGMTVSPQRSTDPSPVAKSPLLGAAPPGGLLPTPEKLYTNVGVGFRPIQPQGSQEFPPVASERGRDPDIPPLAPTPVRNPRPPLLATPPGFPPPFLPQGIHQSPIHPKPGQKPASPVQPVNISPDKGSPNKSPPQLPPSSKGFNPNAPTFVPMGLQGVQRPANPPPTSSILGPPPISKLTNFPPPVGSSILGNAPPIGGGPRMVGPNILPVQPPQPPPPPPSGSQTSILGQPPTPSINPHIFNPPPMPPGGQQNFPPKPPPNQPMYGQFDGSQPSPGVLQPHMPPFGIIFPGTPGGGAPNFVGQHNQNFGGVGGKEFLSGTLDGVHFLPNPISQPPMLNQGRLPSVSSNEMSRFGIPLLNVGKSELDPTEGPLSSSNGIQSISLPPMLMTSEAAGVYDSGSRPPQMVRGNMFGMGLHPVQSGLRPMSQDTAPPSDPTPKPDTAASSLLGNFSTSNLDIFPTFLPMSERGAPSVSEENTVPPSSFMMVSPSVFTAIPASTATANSTHDTSVGSGDGLLPIGTERAQKGSLGGNTGPATAAAATASSTASGNSSSFTMMAPGINPSSVWRYSGEASQEDSDWSHQVGGASVTSDPHSWPASLKPSSRGGGGDVIITQHDSLQSVLARVGLTEHMELFQSNEIDLEALVLMSEKDFSEIGLPQAAQRTLLNAIGRKTFRDDPLPRLEDSAVSMATNQQLEQGEGRGFPDSRQHQDPL